MKMYRVFYAPENLSPWRSGWLREGYGGPYSPVTDILDYAAVFSSFEEADRAAKSVKLERHTIFSN